MNGSLLHEHENHYFYLKLSQQINFSYNLSSLLKEKWELVTGSRSVPSVTKIYKFLNSCEKMAFLSTNLNYD